MLGSKNSKSRTESGSPIVEGRVSVLASGGPSQRKTRNAVVQWEGKSYTVPVDENGRVPEDALVSRFLDTSVGPRPNNGIRRLGADARHGSRKTHKVPEGGFTPEEIVATGWWDDPGKSDIEGIDDGSYGALLDFGPGNGKLEEAVGGKIAIFAPTGAERRRIASVLNENYTSAELKAAAWKYGLIISVGNPKSVNKNWLGYYKYRQDGVSTPIIVLEPNASDETICHEFGHHLRAADPSRSGLTKAPYTIAADGRVVPYCFQRNYPEKVNLEEAANVAETTGRTRGLDKTNCGYYWKIPKDNDPHAAFRADRSMLTGGVGKDSKPKKGKRLMDAVEEDFDDTMISRMRYKGHKSAMGYVKQLREEEVLPPRKSKKPAKKPKARNADLEEFFNGGDPWTNKKTTGGKKR